MGAHAPSSDALSKPPTFPTLDRFMSESSFSSQVSVDIEERRAARLTPRSPASPETNSPGDEQFTPRPPVSRTSIPRHFSSLQEHADVVRVGTLTGETTPRDRREGFVIELPPKESDKRHSVAGITAHLNKGSTFDINGELVLNANEYNAANDATTISKRFSFPAGDGISRADTMSSLAGSIEHGKRRHGPDLRMFTSDRPKHDRDDEEGKHAISEHIPRLTKAGRALTRKMSIVPAKSVLEEKEKMPRLGVLPQDPDKFSDNAKVGLKGRRNLGRLEALRLTLPLQHPGLPARRRLPMSEDVDLTNLYGIAPSRPRSPKTPWVRDTPTSWLPHDTLVPPPTILEYPEVDKHARDSDPLQTITTPGSERTAHVPRQPNSPSSPFKFRRGRGRKSDDAFTDSPDGPITPTEHDRTSEELKQLNTKPSRRWRWSGHWNPGDNASIIDSPASDKIEKRVSISWLFNPLKRHRNSPLTSPVDSLKPDMIANMAMPPPFIPPGLNRVSTSPKTDERGDLKDKLGHFFFDMYGNRTPKPSPGGVWDSDAILMSQMSNITPNSSSSQESPQGPTSPADFPPPDMVVKDDDPGKEWFRVRIKSAKSSDEADRKDSNSRAAEARAKFEWCVPEHYPNSPLCPLHVKYKGPFKGTCLYHERKSGGGRRGTMKGQGRVKTSPRALVKKRRKMSLSAP
ncbi:hypothetical protein EJ04DRAFT_275056 [Polyplosphaeria fusca]|uniref:Uncharacterized protein n=1 Tax=Polyplosphaeria fusca TaxID=682080 RepID=A0A9P4QY52_9PLEO|nr:hypothetical protein EJ04DRAFT_275056 [Polyplosphaeria fusca]